MIIGLGMGSGNRSLHFRVFFFIKRGGLCNISYVLNLINYELGRSRCSQGDRFFFSFPESGMREGDDNLHLYYRNCHKVLFSIMLQ